MKKKILSLALTLALTLTLIPATVADGEDDDVFIPPGGDSPTFSDVPEDHWAYEAIEFVYAEGILVGSGGDSFGPDLVVTREQLAVIIGGANKIDASQSVPSPTIADEASISIWAIDRVKHAVENGWMLLDGDGNFNPQETVTREEMAFAVAWLVKTAQEEVIFYIGDNLTYAQFAGGYTDKAEIGEDYLGAVGFLNLYGIMFGTPDGFLPAAPVSRAELAMAIYRAMTWTFPDDGRTFLDVPRQSWMYESVEYMYGEGIMRGLGFFGPNASPVFGPDLSVTRDQMAAMLCNIHEIDVNQNIPDMTIPDMDNTLPEPHWATNHAKHAVENGWMLLDGDGNFNPGITVSREEIALMMTGLIDDYDQWLVPWVEHWVVRGDTLQSIADSYGTTIDNIKRDNANYFADLDVRNSMTGLNIQVEHGVCLKIYLYEPLEKGQTGLIMSTFSDSLEIWRADYRDAVAYMVAIGWMPGTGEGLWSPRGSVPRAHVAAFLARALQADEAPVPVRYHLVTFENWNQDILKTQAVRDGEAATAPSNPTRSGWTFTGWSAAFSNVTSDLTVTAQYTQDEPQGPPPSTDTSPQPSPEPSPEPSPPPENTVVVEASDDGSATLTNNQLNQIRQERMALEIGFSNEDGEALGTIAFSPEAAGQMISDATGGSVTVSLAAVETAELDLSGLTEEQAETIAARPVFEFTVTDANNRAITQFGGNVTVTLPYELAEGENPNAIVVYYLTADGIKIVNGRYDAATQSVVITTRHFSLYVIGYNPVSFTDVANSHANKAAIDFIAAREITTGIGNNRFGPAEALSRAQLLVMLMKAFGYTDEEAANFDGDNFDDADGWYAGWIGLAKRDKITAGIGGNKFGLDTEVTREQMLLLLYNTLDALDELPEDGDADIDFDADAFSSWALADGNIDKIAAVLSWGVYPGGEVDPQADYARALMAQMLYNLLTR
ncbi:MAG: S-layer homology domain-containing protein [Oscillospiraceae bacterium]|nr:S-layer homology domain-containing protein [Oscillospiraceae bacterium]